ncbi:MAG: hypothetical protein R3A10_00555 [Caldilineaceae bacterium]
MAPGPGIRCAGGVRRASTFYATPRHGLGLSSHHRPGGAVGQGRRHIPPSFRGKCCYLAPCRAAGATSRDRRARRSSLAAEGALGLGPACARRWTRRCNGVRSGFAPLSFGSTLPGEIEAYLQNHAVNLENR